MITIIGIKDEARASSLTLALDSRGYQVQTKRLKAGFKITATRSDEVVVQGASGVTVCPEWLFERIKENAK